jgi:hypothetical protein
MTMDIVLTEHAPRRIGGTLRLDVCWVLFRIEAAQDQRGTTPDDSAV